MQNLEWMGPETRQKAQEKLARFTTKIGYPDKWRDYGKLRSFAAILWQPRAFEPVRLQSRHRQAGQAIDRGECT